MRRFAPPLAVAILALAAGCADTTSPAATGRTTLSPSALLGNPPPPPSDTSGTYASSSMTGTLSFNAIYFMNPTDKAGFIHFNTTQPAGFVASPDASIDFHLGTITGAGTISGPVTDLSGAPATLSIDLSKVVSQGVFNGDCSNSCATVSAPATLTTDNGKVVQTIGGSFTVGVYSETVPPIPVTTGQ